MLMREVLMPRSDQNGLNKLAHSILQLQVSYPLVSQLIILSLWHKSTTHMAQKNPVAVHGVLNILYKLQSAQSLFKECDLSYSFSMFQSFPQSIYRQTSFFIHTLAKMTSFSKTTVQYNQCHQL